MFNNNIDYKLPVFVLSNGLFATLSLIYEGYLGIVENQDFYRRFFAENIVVVPEERYREISKMEDKKKKVTCGCDETCDCGCQKVRNVLVKNNY